jgi:hypothetical protein
LAGTSGTHKLRHPFVAALTLWHFASTTGSQVVAVVGRHVPAAGS